jgi:hypothetical protein
MRPGGLLEAFSFLGSWSVPSLQQPRGLQHPMGRTRANRHKTGIQHHESQPAVPFGGMTQEKGDDGLLLPWLQPDVSRNPEVGMIAVIGCKTRITCVEGRISVYVVSSWKPIERCSRYAGNDPRADGREKRTHGTPMLLVTRSSIPYTFPSRSAAWSTAFSEPPD